MENQAAPLLTTDRLRLRAYKFADFEGFADFYASERSRYADGPVSRHTAWHWFAAGAGRWSLTGYGAWTIERQTDALPVGVISLNHPVKETEERELGWLLWDGFEGNGYATEAARAGRNFAIKTLKWQSFVSYIAKDNQSSVRLAGRLGAMLDVDATRRADAETLVYRHMA